MSLAGASDEQRSTGDRFTLFQETFALGQYAAASEIFEEALGRDPGGAFRHFVAYASGSLIQALNRGGRKTEILRRLDALTGEEPHVHYLANPDDPNSLQFVIALREANLDKGLPSMLLVPQGKSASVAVSAIFNSGFSLPSVCYSLVHMDIIDSWAADYARGGACYATHLLPSAEKVAQLKKAGINRMIVHVRDPRQALISVVHHFDSYPDQMPELRARAVGATVNERARKAIAFFRDTIQWISGWVDAEKDMEILFSTHEQFVVNKEEFVERYLDFYGADRKHFSYKNALSQQEGTDYHFRVGKTDEWRQVLEPAFADQISAMLPDKLKAKFGWPD
jgi:hypothetical protein